MELSSAVLDMQIFASLGAGYLIISWYLLDTLAIRKLYQCIVWEQRKQAWDDCCALPHERVEHRAWRQSAFIWNFCYFLQSHTPWQECPVMPVMYLSWQWSGLSPWLMAPPLLGNPWVLTVCSTATNGTWQFQWSTIFWFVFQCGAELPCRGQRVREEWRTNHVPVLITNVNHLQDSAMDRMCQCCLKSHKALSHSTSAKGRSQHCWGWQGPLNII